MIILRLLTKDPSHVFHLTLYLGLGYLATKPLIRFLLDCTVRTLVTLYRRMRVLFYSCTQVPAYELVTTPQACPLFENKAPLIPCDMYTNL